MAWSSPSSGNESPSPTRQSARCKQTKLMKNHLKHDHVMFIQERYPIILLKKEMYAAVRMNMIPRSTMCYTATQLIMINGNDRPPGELKVFFLQKCRFCRLLEFVKPKHRHLAQKNNIQVSVASPSNKNKNYQHPAEDLQSASRLVQPQSFLFGSGYDSEVSWATNNMGKIDMGKIEWGALCTYQMVHSIASLGLTNTYYSWNLAPVVKGQDVPKYPSWHMVDPRSCESSTEAVRLAKERNDGDIETRNHI